MSKRLPMAPAVAGRSTRSMTTRRGLLRLAGVIWLVSPQATFAQTAGRTLRLGILRSTAPAQDVPPAMLDSLREADWLPRGIRREMRRVETAIHALEHQHGRAPNEAELATALGMSLPDYQHLLLEARGYQLVYLEDLSGEDGDDFLDRHATGQPADPLTLLEDADMRSSLIRAIDGLPEREKMMMALYYEQDLNLREIGDVMGVTESRVCQLHSQAIARLRVAVTGEGAPLTKSRRGRKPKAAA